MKTLVLIGNNLKYDTRVKRHIKAIAKFSEKVHVLARPIPDDKFGLSDIENVKHDFFVYCPQAHPINKTILNFGEEWGLKEIFLKCFPILECESYFYLPCIEKYTALLEKMVSGDRWKDITSRKSETMDISNALSYPLIFFETAVQFAQKALEIEADVVLCNDVDTLLAGVIHKKKFGSRLIYDFHDIMADISDGIFPQMYSNVLVQFEKYLIQFADIVMSISEADLIWSKQHYGFKAPAIPMLNCSDAEKRFFVRTKKIHGNIIRIYYHGMSDATRGLLPLVKAVQKFDQFVAVLRCLPSDDLENIKKYVKENKLDSKVFFLEPVQPIDIPKMANKDGDIGFHLCNTKDCLNWRFALTNKFIEYTKAALPIITSDTYEQGKIVRQYHNGWILDENSEEGIVKVLERILQEKKEISKMSRRSRKVAKRIFSWTRYEKALKAVIMGNSVEVKKNSITFIPDEHQLEIWNREDAFNYNKVLMEMEASD